jgi:hypothetical protein
VRLTDAPNVLTWQGAEDLLAQVQLDFRELLVRRLYELVARVELDRDAELDRFVEEVLAALDEDERDALLCEPEISFRLLWPSHHRPAGAIGFVIDKLQSRGAGVRLQRLDHAGIALDLSSPLARQVDVSGTLARRETPGPCYSIPARDAVIAKGLAACRLIEQGLPEAWAVVQGFTKLLHYLPDEESATQFSSGSSGQFVGRTVIANAHLDKITLIEVSEALVHEAIHSVLYMDENLRPWVLDPALYAGPARIASPWTGTALPLRPYLQACFVWYGLTHYWSEMLRRRVIDDRGAKRRLEIALAGFARGNLLDRIETFLPRLSRDVKDAIDLMQQGVTTCLPRELVA